MKALCFTQVEPDNLSGERALRQGHGGNYAGAFEAVQGSYMHCKNVDRYCCAIEGKQIAIYQCILCTL